MTPEEVRTCVENALWETGHGPEFTAVIVWDGPEWKVVVQPTKECRP